MYGCFLCLSFIALTEYIMLNFNLAIYVYIYLYVYIFICVQKSTFIMQKVVFNTLAIYSLKKKLTLT